MNLEEHLPLVRSVARAVHRERPHAELDDLVNHGVIGLADAIAKFRPEKGARFATYARFRVRGAILDGLRASGRFGRYGTYEAIRSVASTWGVASSGGAPPPDVLAEVAEVARAAEDCLTPRQRDAVFRRHVLDATFDELGARTGVSNVAAFQSYRVAMRRFRERLGVESRVG